MNKPPYFANLRDPWFIVAAIVAVGGLIADQLWKNPIFFVIFLCGLGLMMRRTWIDKERPIKRLQRQLDHREGEQSELRKPD